MNFSETWARMTFEWRVQTVYARISIRMPIVTVTNNVSVGFIGLNSILIEISGVQNSIGARICLSHQKMNCLKILTHLFLSLAYCDIMNSYNHKYA